MPCTVLWISLFSLVIARSAGETQIDHFTSKCGADVKLSWTPAYVLQEDTEMACGLRCKSEETCTGFNFDSRTSSCEIFVLQVAPQNCSDAAFVAAPGVKTFEVTEPCLHGGSWNLNSLRCDCELNWAGERCHRTARDCSEIFDSCPSCHTEFAVYDIKPDSGPAFPVKCYLRWGGYTYLMERQGGECSKVPFNQNWEAYKAGFGAVVDFECDFWLGLEQMHRITSIPGKKYTMDTTVRFQSPILRDYYQTFLENFHVGDEANGYRLSSTGWSPGQGDGDAGDAYFRSHDPANSAVGAPFSTVDRDQDASANRHCAAEMQSGWWFSGCGLTNPTGVWRLTADATRDTSAPTMWWGVNTLGNQAVESLEMKVKGQDT